MGSGGFLPAVGCGLLAIGVAGTALATEDNSSPGLQDVILADRRIDRLPALEEVTVYATNGNAPSLSATTITRADMQQFNRDTLDRAFALASGTSVSMVGPRNETDIWIRGFDRWRVPLYQDGIPVYLPVDKRIDFRRFSTIDLG